MATINGRVARTQGVWGTRPITVERRDGDVYMSLPDGASAGYMDATTAAALGNALLDAAAAPRATTSAPAPTAGETITHGPALNLDSYAIVLNGDSDGVESVQVVEKISGRVIKTLSSKTVWA